MDDHTVGITLRGKRASGRCSIDNGARMVSYSRGERQVRNSNSFPIILDGPGNKDLSIDRIGEESFFPTFG